MHFQKRPAIIAGTACYKPLSRSFADMPGQLIDEKSANQFHRELEQKIEHDLWNDGAVRAL